MRHHRDVTRPVPLLLLPLLALGCEEDLPSPAQPDASVPDASGLDGAAPVMVQPDASASTCDAAHPCAVGEVCAPDGMCAPRCDAQQVCLVATATQRVSDLLADGETLYFATLASQDALGNSLADGKIWRKDAQGEPQILSTGLNNRFGDRAYLTEAGDHVMWHEAGQLRRVAKASPSVVEPLYETSCGRALPLPGGKLAVQARGGLFLGAADGSAPLAKISSAVTSDPLVDGTQITQCSALHYADQSLFRVRPRPKSSMEDRDLYAIVGVDLRDDVETTYAANTLSADSVLGVAPPYFFDSYTPYPFSVVRSDLGGGRENDVTIASGSPTNTVRVDVRGAWIYLAMPRSSPTSSVELSRSALTPPVTSQPLAAEGSFRVPSDASVSAIAATDRALFVTVASLRGSWIYRLPLPAAP